jgi:hypothetical protein
MGTDEQIEVTEFDHEAGFKEIPIFYKAAGKSGRIKLAAPSHRVALQVYGVWMASGDAESVVKACLPTDADPQILSKLTLASAAQVQMVCIAIVFGDEELKKNLQWGQAFLKLLLASRNINGENLSSSASLPATAPAT